MAMKNVISEKIESAVAMQAESENHELNGLAGLALEVDGGAAAVSSPGDPNAPEVLPAGPNYGLEAAGAVDMLGAMICGYSPACKPMWGDETRASMAASIAPVMEKYNFTFGSAPPELLAIIVCGPVLYQSAQTIALEMAEKKARIAAAKNRTWVENVQAAQPVAPTESPETLRHPQVELYA